MERKQYAQLHRTSLVTLGGYTWVRPEAWDKYLKGVMKDSYPDYHHRHAENGKKSSLWKENACIVEALDEYLFHQYGVFIPADNLFKIYNEAGEGVMPDKLIEAISAVIEPLGFEVDKVLVPDEELGSGLGYQDKLVDLSGAQEFEGQAGLCMINIKDGYSHAFFWDRMDPRKFLKDQFRMALLVSRKQAFPTRSLSVTTSVTAFCRLVAEHLVCQESTDRGSSTNELDQLQLEIESLARYVRDKRTRKGRNFRDNVALRLAAILDLFQGGKNPPNGHGISRNAAFILETGRMVQRIVREAGEIGP